MHIPEPKNPTPLTQLDTLAAELYRDLHLQDDEPNWNTRVRRVTVILSASRSGSSLVFQALTDSNQVVAPAGEHEPWLLLSHNKFPYTASDATAGLHNREQLLTLLRNDLLVREAQVDGDELLELWRNRLVTQQDPGALAALDRLQHQYRGRLIDRAGAQELEDAINAARTEPWLGEPGAYIPVENPPYISQPLARRATLAELESLPVVFKSPSDAYRPGFYEDLFPSATITYVHLTRGFAQTVNGLMDGWTRNEAGFTSNPVGRFGHPLNIEGYSQSFATRNYWCFDLFPDWQQFRSAALLEVCTQQWLQAHEHIIRNHPHAPRIQFEDFYLQREAFMGRLHELTGIDTSHYGWDRLIMSTEKPAQYRWKKRQDLFDDASGILGDAVYQRVVALQQQLGYSMDETTWR